MQITSNWISLQAESELTINSTLINREDKGGVYFFKKIYRHIISLDPNYREDDWATKQISFSIDQDKYNE